LARATLEAAQRTGATDVLFPFDTAILPEALGATIRWTDGEPTIEAPPSPSILDLDPIEVLARGRIPAAQDTVKFLTSSSRVAAHVPSPRELSRLVAEDPAEEDVLASAEDLVLALLRSFLEAGASSVVVRDPSPGLSDLGAVGRLAAHFAVPCFATADPDVATVSPAHGLDSGNVARALDRARGASMVLTRGPVPADVELGRFAAFAAEVARC